MKMLKPISTILIPLILIVFACQYSTVATAQDGNARNAECRNASGRCGSSAGSSGSRNAGSPSNKGSDAAALMGLGQGLIEMNRKQKEREAREEKALRDNKSTDRVNSSGTHLSESQSGKPLCNACHHKEKKLVGPSWNDISNRYSASQLDSLAKTARYGNKGNTKWGPIHCVGESSLSEKDAKAIVSTLTGIRPVDISSSTLSHNAGEQTGNCHPDLAHLHYRIPSFSAPDISSLRAKLLETDIRQTITAAKQQGYGPNQAVDAALLPDLT